MLPVCRGVSVGGRGRQSSGAASAYEQHRDFMRHHGRDQCAPGGAPAWAATIDKLGDGGSDTSAPCLHLTEQTFWLVGKVRWQRYHRTVAD